METKAKGKSDEDCLFLEQVLDKLYDFGSKKKKKRKRCDDEESLASKAFCSEDEAAHIQQQSKQTDQSTPQDNQVEIVTFQDPRKKQKNMPPPSLNKVILPQTKDQTHSDEAEKLSLEQARLEVHRFGITGYRKEQQREFEQDRAVMLGARPPKKGYVNYKVLQQQIKEKKQKVKEEEVDLDLKKKKKKKNNKDKKKQSTPGTGSGPSGQVGRFKNGMLILSSKEIQKIKGTKGSR